MRYVSSIALAIIVLCSSPVKAEQMYGDACEIQNIAGAPYPPPENCSGLKFLRVYSGVAPTGTIVGVPNPQCAEKVDPKEIVKQIIELAKAAFSQDQEKLTRLAADMFAFAKQKLETHIINRGGFIADVYARNFAARTDKGNCVALIAWVPAQAEVVGFRYAVWDNVYGTHGCNATNDCGSGFARFLTLPQRTEDTGVLQIYNVVFLNWSHNLERTPSMVLFFRVPPGIQVETQM